MRFPALPLLDADNTAYWTSGSDGVLSIHRCEDCRRYVHPPAPVCRWCTSRAVRPEVVSGAGTLYSYSHNVHDWTGDGETFIYALAELDEQPGLRISAYLRGGSPEHVRIGMPVRVDFEPQDGIWFPVLRPAEGKAS